MYVRKPGLGLGHKFRAVQQSYKPQEAERTGLRRAGPPRTPATAGAPDRTLRMLPGRGTCLSPALPALPTGNPGQAGDRPASYIAPTSLWPGSGSGFPQLHSARRPSSPASPRGAPGASTGTGGPLERAGRWARPAAGAASAPPLSRGWAGDRAAWPAPPAGSRGPSPRPSLGSPECQACIFVVGFRTSRVISSYNLMDSV